MLRLLREGILSDGRVDEIEAQMLLRLTEPFERFCDAKMNRIVSVLRQMLSDGVISADESRQISAILGGL